MTIINNLLCSRVKKTHGCSAGLLEADNFHNAASYNKGIKYYYCFEIKYPVISMNEFIQQIFLKLLL